VSIRENFTVRPKYASTSPVSAAPCPATVNAKKKMAARISPRTAGTCKRVETYTMPNAPPNEIPNMSAMTAAIGNTVRTARANARSSISLNESGRSSGVTAPL